MASTVARAANAPVEGQREAAGEGGGNGRGRGRELGRASQDGERGMGAGGGGNQGGAARGETTRGESDWKGRERGEGWAGRSPGFMYINRA